MTAISEIKNENLRKAAEFADSQGENKYNNRLDSNELLIFIQKARKDDCKTQDILSVTSNIKIAENDNNTLEKIQILENLKKLENEIETKKAELNFAKSDYNQKKPESSLISGLTGIAGFVGGAWLGAKTAGPIAAAVSSTGIGAFAAPAIMLIGAIGGGVLGGYAAISTVDSLENNYGSHQRRVQHYDAEKFKETTVRPLEEQLKELENQKEELEANLYS